MERFELAVIGGGPAGLAAALEARKSGIGRIILFERERELGGILQQCVHSGFGLHLFKEELTGPEYAERFIESVRQSDIVYKTDTTVLEISGSEPSRQSMLPTGSWRLGRRRSCWLPAAVSVRGKPSASRATARPGFYSRQRSALYESGRISHRQACGHPWIGRCRAYYGPPVDA